MSDTPKKHIPTHPRLLARARELRQTSTKAEETLWQHLRNRKLQGLKFRRQRPETGCVMDFYCDAAKVVVELDGITHDGKVKQAADANRDQAMTRNGYLVLRFWNSQVWDEGHRILEQTASVCLERVKEFGTENQVHAAAPARGPSKPRAAEPRSTAKHPHPCPLPEGEGGRGVAS